MQSPPKSQGIHSPNGREPILDTAFNAAAFVVTLIAAFAILIMGIFASNSDTPTVMIVGSTIILGGLALLLLMIIARLAARRFASRDGQSAGRTALVVTAMVYCVGIPALAFGTWHFMNLFMDAPTYQEASIEVPNSIPQF